MHSWLPRWAYGLTDRLTLGAHLPYLSRQGIREAHLEGGTPELHDHGNANGLGDLKLLGQYSLVRAEGRELAILGGLKLPSGQTDVADQGSRFDVEHQPGSGS